MRGVAAAAALICAMALPSAAALAAPITNINILIKGQSNAAFFYVHGGMTILQNNVSKLLGFDNKTYKITLLGEPQQTMWSGVGLIRQPGATTPSWLIPGPHGTWIDDAMQRTFLAYLRALPAPIRASPTITLWLHNETDTYDRRLTQPEWQSAIRHAIAEERAALGQSPATTPIDFVYIPFDCATLCLQIAGFAPQVQFMQAGFANLAADPALNAHIAAQFGDANMDETGGTFGGMHMDKADATTLAHRLVPALANQLWRYALPGSAEAAAKGTLPAIGPTATTATRTGRYTVRVATTPEPGSTGLAPLTPQAAEGAGWAIVDNKHVLYPTAATRDGNIIDLTFPTPIPTTPAARLYYGWGTARLIVLHDLPWKDHATAKPGRNAAIYDSNDLPLRVPAAGLPILEITRSNEN